jgi:uncharacterized protein YbbK (DUF523 family)
VRYIVLAMCVSGCLLGNVTDYNSSTGQYHVDQYGSKKEKKKIIKFPNELKKGLVK